MTVAQLSPTVVTTPTRLPYWSMTQSPASTSWPLPTLMVIWLAQLVVERWMTVAEA